MAVTFPLSRAEFADLIDPAGMSFHLPASRELDIDGSGQVIDSNLGARLWRGSVTLVPKVHADAVAIETLLAILNTSGASVMLYDRRKPYPRLDPNGLILGATVPTILSLAVSNRELALTGLPAGYTLSRGDYLSFSYLDVTGATRYALHAVVDVTVTADGTGVTPSFEVVPNIRPGAVITTPVTLAKPACKVVLMPNSLGAAMGQAGMVSSGQTFEFTQTLR